MNEENFYLEAVESDDKRIEEYEDLLLRRDQLFKESRSILIEYTQEFGDMIMANFELKVECIKKKKIISYCRRRINRGLPIEMNLMQGHIDKEMKLYYAQLKEMAENNNRAKKAVSINDFRLSRAKKIYRRLTKLLHPDINIKTAEDENLRELWEQIYEAYQRTDVDALEDLEVLVRKVLDDRVDESFELNLIDIEDRKERVENQINDMITSEPYIYKELIEDDEKKKAYKEQLQTEHDDYEEYLVNLSQAIDDMLREGGVSIVWQMN
jgi:iron-sulfur cluster repair protein YtfE (RIC family)